VKNRASLFPFIAVLFLMALPMGKLQADDNKAPMWKRPLPGTRAFLGDDGGGVNTKTVCDTADRYRDWLKMESPPGCQTFQHDLKVVIEIVLLDAISDTVGETWLPLVKINIPSRKFTGYCQLLALHPIVPAGTKVQMIGRGGFRLHKTADVKQEEGLDLGEKVSATVLSYDPTQDDKKWDLYVSIDDGPHAGKKGWMLSLPGVDTEDGVPMDQFDQAVIENKPRW
jgi:hypothetical protein